MTGLFVPNSLGSFADFQRMAACEVKPSLSPTTRRAWGAGFMLLTAACAASHQPAPAPGSCPSRRVLHKSCLAGERGGHTLCGSAGEKKSLNRLRGGFDLADVERMKEAIGQAGEPARWITHCLSRPLIICIAGIRRPPIPPWRHPRGKTIVSLVNSHTNRRGSICGRLT